MVIGNPPFVGGNLSASPLLGEDYVSRVSLQRLYAGIAYTASS